MKRLAAVALALAVICSAGCTAAALALAVHYANNQEPNTEFVDPDVYERIADQTID